MVPGRRAGEPLAGLHSRIEAYYGAKVAAHGPTPEGVDWTCAPTQELRFVQLLKLCDLGTSFSLNDVGCGYGAMWGYLKRRHRRVHVDYLGIDLSRAMIEAARQLWKGDTAARFLPGPAIPRRADYSIASGIFNVKLDEPDELWIRFIETTLDALHAASSKGFAFNMKHRLAPGVPARPELYRGEPETWCRYCERRYGAATDVVSGYGLREFTILVRSSRA